jgi:hypothetical protein
MYMYMYIYINECGKNDRMRVSMYVREYMQSFALPRFADIYIYIYIYIYILTCKDPQK